MHSVLCPLFRVMGEVGWGRRWVTVTISSVKEDSSDRLAGRLRISDRLKILLTLPKDFVFFSPPIPYFRNNNTASADVIRIL